MVHALSCQKGHYDVLHRSLDKDNVGDNAVRKLFQLLLWISAVSLDVSIISTDSGRCCCLRTPPTQEALLITRSRAVVSPC